MFEPTAEPFDLDAWFAALDRYNDVPFMPDGREQPSTPDGREDLLWD